MASDTIDRVQAKLHITLFGAFEVQIDSAPMARLRSRKEQWLMALLVLRNGQPVAREWLAGMLWPDSPQPQSIAYLRRGIYLLKRALGDEGRRIKSPTVRTLCLDLSAAEVDVVSFDCALKERDDAALEHAVELYRGPLLEGCDEDWVYLERSTRAAQYVEALEELAEARLAQGCASAGIACLEKAVLMEPYRESLYGLLMRSLAARGDHAAVADTFRRLRRRLHDDLQSEVSADIADLYRELQADARRSSRPAPPVVAARPAHHQRSSRPQPLTKIVGRGREIAEIRDLLRKGRLVTLTGSGGVGKTRIALEIAELQSASEEIWFVELASAADDGALVGGIVRALGLMRESDRASMEDAVRFLSAHTGLLILDNCEHLLDGCASIAKHLLGKCPDLRILTTSRQSTGIIGELSYPVPSLPTPDPAVLYPARPGEIDKEIVSRLMEFESVRLFFERAQAVCTSLRVTPRTAHAAAEICRRLDGIPLAIELAAARCKTLSADQILVRLSDRFRLLTGGSRLATSHHKTLRALVDWSYELLSREEQSLLKRLSCFTGGWSLDLAEEVCSDDGGRNHEADVVISPHDVMDLLASLVDKSLVLMNYDEIEPRYYLLDTIRQYAAERLCEAEERDVLSAKHGAIMTALVVKLSKEVRGSDQRRCLRRLDAERANIRAAFQWTVTGQQADRALQLCAGLSDYWFKRGAYLEGILWCEQALALGSIDRTALRARALTCYGQLLWSTGEVERALANHYEALAIRSELGDEHGIAWSHDCLGLVYNNMGDYARARKYHEAALTAWRKLGDEKNLSCTLNNLAGIAHVLDENEAARAMWEECLQLKRKLVGELEAALPLNNLANLAHSEGDNERARALHEESLRIRREYGDKRGIARSLANMAMVAMSDRDWASARELTRQGIAGWYEVGSPIGIADGLENLLSIAVKEAREQPQSSLDRSYIVALFAAAAIAIREQCRCPIPLNERPSFDRHHAQIRTMLPPEKFDEATAAGRSMSLDAVVSLAISE